MLFADLLKNLLIRSMVSVEKRIVGIIPARAGSKGIINKNIIDFCGKPLIAWSIEQALSSKYVEEVYVSTDGEQIARVAENYGARIIWRPEESASDMAASEDAIIHAVDTIERIKKIDIVLFLQATSPIRLPQDIDGAVETFLEKGMDSLFSMAVLEDYCIWKKTEYELKSWTYDYTRRGRRQDREKLFLENGSIYLFKPEILKEYGNRLGGEIGMYEMPFDRSFEIDNVQDIELCTYFMKNVI